MEVKVVKVDGNKLREIRDKTLKAEFEEIRNETLANDTNVNLETLEKDCNEKTEELHPKVSDFFLKYLSYTLNNNLNKLDVEVRFEDLDELIREKTKKILEILKIDEDKYKKVERLNEIREEIFYDTSALMANCCYLSNVQEIASSNSDRRAAHNYKVSLDTISKVVNSTLDSFLVFFLDDALDFTKKFIVLREVVNMLPMSYNEGRVLNTFRKTSRAVFATRPEFLTVAIEQSFRIECCYRDVPGFKDRFPKIRRKIDLFMENACQAPVGENEYAISLNSMEESLIAVKEMLGKRKSFEGFEEMRIYGDSLEKYAKRMQDLGLSVNAMLGYLLLNDEIKVSDSDMEKMSMKKEDELKVIENEIDKERETLKDESENYYKLIFNMGLQKFEISEKVLNLKRALDYFNDDELAPKEDIHAGRVGVITKEEVYVRIDKMVDAGRRILRKIKGEEKQMVLKRIFFAPRAPMLNYMDYMDYMGDALSDRRESLSYLYLIAVKIGEMLNASIGKKAKTEIFNKGEEE